MKLISCALIAGLVALYFMDIAFRINPFNWEMLTHSAIRFVLGFLLLGIGVFHAHTLKLKSALIVALVLVLADDIVDYFRNVNSFSFEVMIHSVFILFWGALVGFLFMRNLNKNSLEQK
jgi:H+/Cl- antiporter ClcA